MALRLGKDGRITGQRDDFIQYEKAITDYKILCPFTVAHYGPDGELITNRPIPLTYSGRPKIDLWRD